MILVLFHTVANASACLYVSLMCEKGGYLYHTLFLHLPQYTGVSNSHTDRWVMQAMPTFT